ncbi:MAG TPA: branched-chain amino acid ABC transporter permease, partial [Firmicutes bacterium]|nr:branched-chain amino acid ABC transporter permease [Bacillota bacterium]
MTFSKNKPLIPLLLLALAIVMPLIFKHPYLMRVVIMIFYFGVTAYGWDVIGGYAGQVSVGQGMFFAVGAYSVALGYLVSNLTPVVGALIGVIV